ncbi:phosphatase PAP2 family protein [Pseudactinotalea sp. HY158]|nr:phosphatase PAP2 family protein [Pseudactinotalea sp. HY158]
MGTGGPAGARAPHRRAAPGPLRRRRGATVTDVTDVTDVTSPTRGFPTRLDFLVRPLLATGVLLLGLWATWFLFLRSELGQVVDDLTLTGRGEPGLPDALTRPVLGVVSAPYIIAAGVVIVGIALLQRRYALAVAAAALYIGSNVTTQLIKGLLDRPDYGAVLAYGNSWPSGHTTVAAAIAVCVLLVVPARGRGPVALVGTLYMVLTGWGTVVAGWHRPADVIGAFMVAGAWYGIVESIRRCVPSQYVVTDPVRTAARGSARSLDVIAGIAAALGVGILAATALSLPGTGDVSPGSGLAQWAYIGSCCGIVAVAAGVQRLLLAVGPHR